MSRRPIIGITTQTLHSIDGIPAALPSSVVMNQRYYGAVSDAGGAPVLIPLLDEDTEALRAVYDTCQGLLIPGGVDVDPAFFGETAHPKLGRTDAPRDRVELQLTRWAVDDGKPLLGLCRGLQIINVALGGTLYQDIPSELPDAIRHDYFPIFGFARDHVAHDVALETGSWLARMLDAGRVPVNSMHHQGIKALAPELVATAVAPDGLVEGVEGRRPAFLVGVQWHPEALERRDPRTRALFRELVEQAARFAPR